MWTLEKEPPRRTAGSDPPSDERGYRRRIDCAPRSDRAPSPGGRVGRGVPEPRQRPRESPARD